MADLSKHHEAAPGHTGGGAVPPAEPRRAEAERQRLFELSPDLLCVANFNGWLEQVNPAWTACLGWTAEELTSRPMEEFLVPDDIESSLEVRARVRSGEAVRGFENRYRCKDGSFRWLSWNVHPSSDEGRIFAVARDITRYKQTERDLIKSEAALRVTAESLSAIQSALPAHIALIDAEGVILSVNEGWREFGRANGARDEDGFVGTNYLEVCESAARRGSAGAGEAAAGIRAVLDRRSPIYEMEYSCPTTAGERWFRLTVTPLREGPESSGGVVMHMDITVQKLAEQKVHRLNRLYAVSSGINEAIVREHDTTELYRQACRIAVERGGLPMAWVGLAEPDGGRIAPVAKWGENASYVDSLFLTTDPYREGGRGPAGQAFRTGRPAVCNDIAADPGDFAYKADALRFGYLSCAVFPLTMEKRAIGVLAVYGDEAGYFGEEEIKLLSSLAADLSFAVESHQREQDRERAETALRESEQRFRQLAENSKETFWIRDLDRRTVLYVSPSFERMWGRSCESLYRSADSWMDAIHPDDRAAVAEAASRIAEAGYDITYRIIRPDGSIRWIHDRASPVRDHAGRVYRVVGTADDITERRLANEKLREQATLLDKAQDAILVCDLGHRILFWNHSAERLYGWSAEEAAGSSVQVLLHRDSPAFAAATRTVLEKGEWVGEMEQWTRAGKSLIVEGRWTLVRDEFDRPRSILAINTDITRRKQLEQQFFRAQRMESIGTLAGGIAHDLNNVLAPILMSTDLLEMALADGRSRELLGMIRSSAQRGASMVRQVLSFARGMEGKRVRVEIGGLMEELRKITADSFDKSVRVEVQVAENVWPLDADPTQLHQVLLNLCMNARDAMPGGGVITLRAANEELDRRTAALHLGASPGRYIRLEVEDTGTGIPQDIVDHIFDPFFTTKEVGQGTGLGLSTAQAIVKGHGGFIEVRSRPAMGSRFTIHLPAGTSQQEPERPASRPELPRGHGETILLVDDEDAVREVTRRTLETFGYRVVTAADGAQGLEIFAADPHAIDAVFTDMMMPVMDGREMIRELRKLRPAVPIIGASGVTGDERAGPADVARFLAKPYSIESMLVALSEVLGS